MGIEVPLIRGAAAAARYVAPELATTAEQASTRLLSGRTLNFLDLVGIGKNSVPASTAISEELGNSVLKAESATQTVDVKTLLSTPMRNFVGSREREFVVVKGDAVKIIDGLRTGDPNFTAKALLREVPNGIESFTEATLGPELKTWIQHYGGFKAGVGIDLDVASKADMLITCHPELYADYRSTSLVKSLLDKHVFPWATGEIQLNRSAILNSASQKLEDTLVVLGSNVGFKF
jgi:hypothetical protein